MIHPESFPSSMPPTLARAMAARPAVCLDPAGCPELAACQSAGSCLRSACAPAPSGTAHGNPCASAMSETPPPGCDLPPPLSTEGEASSGAGGGNNGNGGNGNGGNNNGGNGNGPDLLGPGPVSAEFERAMAAGLDQPVRIVVRVTSLGPAEIVAGRIAHRIGLRAQDRTMESTWLYDISLLRMCGWAMRSGVQCLASGCFSSDEAPSPRRPTTVRFRLASLHPLDHVLPLLSPDCHEVAAVATRVAQLSAQPDGIAAHLLNGFFAHYGIAQGSLSDRQRRALRLILLQALSCGQVPAQDHNPRLSVCVASAPGRGKKLLVQLAAALAPVSEWVKPGETSVAGLCAFVSQRRGGFSVSPGSLPRCDLGTCIIDDFHRTQRSQQHQIEGGLMSVAEDGSVTLTKAGAARYASACALLLTGNPGSTLPGLARKRRPRGAPGIAADRAEDLGLPLDLLSRIDVLVWLDSDADPLDSAQEMAARPATAPAPRGPDEDPALRELRLICAFLRDRFPTVDLHGVTEPLRVAVGDLGAVLREYTARQDSGLDADALVRRISNSLRKLTAAAARLHGRGVATEADVDEAFHMLTLKLEVLRWLAGDVDAVRPPQAREHMVGRAQQLRDLRQRDIRRRFGGRCVKVDAVCAALGLKEKLLRRELWAMDLEPEEGKWRIPDEELYQRLQDDKAREAALRRAKQQPGDTPDEILADEERRALEGDRDARVNVLLRSMKDERFSWEDPLPGVARLVFKDVIPKVPSHLRPYLKALQFMDWSCAQTVSAELCRIPFVSYEPKWDPIFRAMDNRIPPECGQALVSALQPEVDQLLFHPDWLTRGKYALALLWESHMCDHFVAPLLRTLRMMHKKDMPPGMDEVVEAMLTRLDLRDRAEAKALEQGQELR